MVYAQVIVSSRTAVQELTYIVPVAIIPYIKLGSTVIVPLRQKKVRAVVVGLTRTIQHELKNKLREVLEIDKSGLGFNLSQIKTINQLAAYYGASLGEVAYHALAWPSRNIETATIARVHKPTFIQALWPERKQSYLDLIARYCERSSFVLIFSSANQLNDFSSILNSKNIPHILASTAKGVTQLRNKLGSSSKFIVLGLQKLAFVPLAQGDFMVVDEPNYISMTQLRRPFMSVKRISLVRAGCEGVNVVLGANLMSFLDYSMYLSKSLRVIQKKLPVIELSIHARPKSGDILPANLIESLDLGSSCLFLVASKSWSSALVCRSCGTIVACDKCDKAIASSSSFELSCYYCGHTQQLPNRCKICHKSEFIFLGNGSSRLYQKLERVFSGTDLGLVSSLTTEVPNKRIVIATEKIINFPGSKFESSVVVDMDTQLSGVNADGAWHMLNILLFLRTISTKIVIQTRFPDHPIWSVASSGNIAEYLTQELSERKNYNLPPFTEQFVLVGRDDTYKNVQNNYKSICDKLNKHMPELGYSDVITSSFDKGVSAKVYMYSKGRITTKQKAILRKLLPFSWYLSRLD